MTKTKKNPLNYGYLYLNKKVIILLKLIDLLTTPLFKKRNIPEHINKILIVKPDHAGDVLMMTSVLQLIKHTYPSCQIDVLCGSWAVEILKGNPFIRKIIKLDHFMLNRKSKNFPAKIIKHVFDYLKALMILRVKKYDVAFVLRAYGGNLLTLLRLGGVKYIAGHSTGGFGELLDYKAKWTLGHHEVEHYLEVLNAAAITSKLSELQYELYTESTDEKKVTNIINNTIGGPFVVIHPGAGDTRKMLSPESWARIIEKIELAYKIVFTGTNSELPYFSDIIQHMQRDAVNLMGKLSIRELYLLYKKAECIFTVESLSAHIAGCAGVKTVVFCGGINDISQWRPLGHNVEIVRKTIDCSPCLSGCANMDCMKL
ncbi:MAG: glycosyltransferase family 9 protein [Nitrospirae bacterium]|nr:glycosyltransferase family 9 protein [Nitrospirota bacterium]MBF0534064.1 glycosyltransferase family 9 protein [Nitrospirota bacterium]MBF0616223.1 glycosyltransferase family 9 protein [Nitrospirota bacterium]